jgi:hypothetical protein
MTFGFGCASFLWWIQTDAAAKLSEGVAKDALVPLNFSCF